MVRRLLYDMATCPRCKGHLTERHRCPRSPVRTVLDVSLAALAGGFVALLGMALLDPHGQLAFDGVLLVAGALAGVGLERWLRG
jgi:hypothetical protein